MTTYNKTAPGVYIEEVQQSPMITGVGTSVGGFIGWCQIPAQKGAEAQFITNFTEFTNNFGKFNNKSYLAFSVYSFFQEGGTQCYIVNLNGVSVQETPPKTKPKGTGAEKKPDNNTTIKGKKGTLTITAEEKDLSIQFLTTSFDQKIKATVSKSTTTKGKTTSSVAETFPAIDSVSDLVNSITVKSKLIKAALTGTMDFSELKNAGETQLKYEGPASGSGGSGGGSGGDDPKPSGGDDQDLTKFQNDQISSNLIETGLNAFNVVEDVNLIIVPDVALITNQEDQKLAYQKIYDYCGAGEKEGTRKDLFFVGDIPGENTKYDIAKTFVDDLNSAIGSKGANLGVGALYYPWITMQNPIPAFKPDPLNVTVPASGAVAGTYAATDASRGVFKPAAGINDGHLGLALSVTEKLSQTELGIVNEAGINNIRNVPGSGICIWGARTTAPKGQEWQYLNVRRLFIYVEQSIKRSSNWIVFEPNTPQLWGTIIRNVTAFLTNLWREGALFGNSAEEAFFVKVDAENNPPEQRRQGYLVIEIGIAPVFPAEFVIIRIGQKTLPA